MDINIKDSKKCTPLHWACYTCSEMALDYILSMKPNLEAKDIRGLTPLHIAVNCVDKIGSTRCVKALLLRGADRNVEDKEGKTPKDWIGDNIPEYMQKDLQFGLSN